MALLDVRSIQRLCEAGGQIEFQNLHGTDEEINLYGDYRKTLDFLEYVHLVVFRVHSCSSLWNNCAVMEKDAPNCIDCGQPMQLDKKVMHKGKRNKYRIRRFSCSLCDTHETVYADGYRDKANMREAVEEGSELFSKDQFVGWLEDMSKAPIPKQKTPYLIYSAKSWKEIRRLKEAGQFVMAPSLSDAEIDGANEETGFICNKQGIDCYIPIMIS